MTNETWTVDVERDASDNYTIRIADGTCYGDTDAQPIATVYDSDHARLIAVAPELLEANRELASLIRRAQEYLCAYLHPDSGVDDTVAINTLLEMFDGPEQRRIESIARKAIAKAEGRE